MKEADVTIHMMVRDEFPTVVFGLLSVIDAAKKVLVVDTGSRDGTRDWLKKIQALYPNKVRLVLEDNVTDSTEWSFFRYNPPNRRLARIRQWMIDETNTPFIWIVDGDEVYRDISAKQVVRIFNDWTSGVRVVYVPLLWFARDIHTLGDFNPPIYGRTGRLFLKDGLRMHGSFPGEMHMGPDDMDLGPSSKVALHADWVEPYHHFEMVTKPWRRKVVSLAAYGGPQPEVFTRFGKKEKGNGAQNRCADTDAGNNEDGAGIQTARILA